MKVLFLTWRDRTHPDGGGSEVFVEEVAAELVRRGHDVSIRCAAHPGAPHDERLSGVRLLRRGGRLTVYPRSLFWLARHSADVDVVVDVINGLAFWTPLVRRRGVVALVHHLHERQWHIIYPGLRGRVGWFLESRVTPLVYRRTPHLTVSDATREDLAGIGVSRELVTVVRNGVSSQPVPDVGRAPSPRISVLARLVPHKRIEDAIEVVQRLRRTHPELVLDVLGDGWWQDRLVEEIRQRELEGAVVLHGHVDDSTRDRLLAESWLMLLPSVKEGWGLAVLEAAVQGTPTVAYRYAGGPAESVVDGVTGVLVDDLDGLTDATGRLLADADLRERLGRAAAERASRYSWTSTAEAVEKALLEAADPKVRTGRRR